MKKFKVIESFINSGTYQEMVKEIALAGIHSYVCVANVHMTIEAYKDETFRDVVNGANITTPDGMPLAKAMRYLYGIRQDRVAGMDLISDLMEYCGNNGKKIFLYGSTDEILEKIKTKAKKTYPSLQIESYSPPFRNITDKEEESIVNMINNFEPDFVFVALGCPKQEKWMAEHQNKINSCMIGLGGAFEVYAEVKDRAPKWMQKLSLEWLYRLIQDPKRLWRRYLVTNTLFIALFSKQWLINLLEGEKNDK